jgi:hypothetical protein
MSTKLTSVQIIAVQDEMKKMQSTEAEWTACRKSTQSLYKKSNSTWGSPESPTRLAFDTCFAKAPQERLFATFLESNRVPDPFVKPKSKEEVKQLFIVFSTVFPTWNQMMHKFRPADDLWKEEAAARELLEAEGKVSGSEVDSNDDEELGFDTSNEKEISRFVKNIRKRKATHGAIFLNRLSERKRAAFDKYDAALKKVEFGATPPDSPPGLASDGSEEPSSDDSSPIIKQREERESRRRSDVESVMKTFFDMLSKSSSNFDNNNDDDYDTKSHKRAKRAKLKFSQGKYVHLGMLVSESDPNFHSAEPSTEVTLTSLSSLKTKAKYVRPNTWSEFVLLFIRLLRGYICNGFASKASKLFEYFEELTIQHNVGVCSVTALIMYDERNRSGSKNPFDWFQFNQRLFMVATTEFPRVLHLHKNGESSNCTPGVARSHDPTKGRKTSEPFSIDRRSRNGVCTSWARDGCCKFEKLSVGCKFSHWCVKPECQEDSSHRPEACPH